jgi:tetratricopeptide (TPR) repeat protein
MVVDVERFGDRSRTNLNQLAIREGLYKALIQAFRESGVAWANCVSEDRGDGALILIPPDVAKTRLVTSLPARLVWGITRHNATCMVPERIRLRVALHAGEVCHDAHGVAGAAVNHTFRLAEAPALRSALDASPGVLALVVSDWFYDEVVRHDPAAVPSLYRQVRVTVKETAATAWIRVPEPGVGESTAGEDDVSPRQGKAAAAGVGRWGVPRGLASAGDAVEARDSSPSVADGSAGSGQGLRPIPAQLPHDAAGFTGRELELAALGSLAAGEASPAVVISAIDGVAGIGKTALAVHFGHRVAAAFPDGQLYVNLRGFDPDQPPLAPRDVLLRFLRALGTDPSQMHTDIDELASVYRSLLSGRRVLVVLDNAATAEQIRPLLPGAAGCLALVTSRNRLSGLVARDGARRLTLDVLSPVEAIALLTRIIGSGRVAAEPAAAETLARLCGWLPLALRITGDRAAAHRHLRLTDLVDELAVERDRLDMLAADEEATQIRAVFSWSYRALPAEAARAFRLLSLHPGQDISAPAAAALLGTTIPDIRRTVATLTGGHLLEESARNRYQFHDLVRVYATECAQITEPEPERTAAVRRLLSWYMHTADSFARTLYPGAVHVPLDLPKPHCQPLIFTTYQQAVDWAQAESANLVPVSRQAMAIGDDVIAWKLAMTLFPPLAHYRKESGLFPALHFALAATQRLADRDAEAWILASLGEAYNIAGTPARTAEFCQRALAIWDETGNSLGQWATWHMQGMSSLDLERFGEAMDCFQKALTAGRRTLNPRAEGMSMTALGVVYQHLGSYDAAIDLYRKALAILSRTRDKWQQAWGLGNLAGAYRAQGHISDAVDLYQQAIAIFREVKDRWQEAEILAELGQAQRTGGQPDAARQSWRQALSIFEEFHAARADQIRAQLNDLSVEEDQAKLNLATIEDSATWRSAVTGSRQDRKH